MSSESNDITSDAAAGPSAKLKTARSLKWNVVDRVATQLLYAVTGIVLARMLSQDEFGLVGACLVFQAFASLLVDSGFWSALMQRKSPTDLDYSTVLWFNMLVACVLYIALYACAPLIALLFGGDPRLITLSRVMFVSLVINAGALVQNNRFMKQMNVRPIAVGNTIALVAGGITGIWLAVAGYGAWAIVWQTITVAAVKTLLLWVMSEWRPLMRFSWTALKSFFAVGSGMMLTSFLNTMFLNVYSFFIGNRVGLTALGYYSQSDKWSKMFTVSLSSVLTSSFLPVLSAVQDDSPRFANMSAKMNRMTCYLTFPSMIGLMIMARPIFHVLFGTKWDPSIILFQLLLVRGIFTVLTGLYSNYLLAVGRARVIFWMEVARDTVALAALAATFPLLAETRPDNPVWGVEIMLWGQVLAGVVAWGLTLWAVGRYAPVSRGSMISGALPYLAETFAIGALLWAMSLWIDNAWILLGMQAVIGAALYLGINAALRSRIQADALDYVRGRL